MSIGVSQYNGTSIGVDQYEVPAGGGEFIHNINKVTNASISKVNGVSKANIFKINAA